MSTIELIAHAKTGDHEAFTALMRAHESEVRFICRRFAKDPDDTEDLVLETFVEAYLKLYQLHTPESFGSWLRCIALNLCRSWYRAPKMETVPLPFDPPVPEAEEVQEDRMMLGMDLLSAAHRRALDLHYRVGLSYQEMADEIGVPIGTVMSRMHRARNALKDIVETPVENTMEKQPGLERRFRMEIELLEGLKAESDAVDGIERVNEHSEPMVRLRQVLETHPPSLVDLLRVADSNQHLVHLAGVARLSMHAAMPVMASCTLSDDEMLIDRATRMAEYWIVRPWYGLRGANLFLDTLIASSAATDRKVLVLVRLIQAVKDSNPASGGGHHVIWELTRVLLGYPDEAFPVLWEALWQLDEDDLVECGVRKAIAHLVEPLSDALIDEVRSGNSDRVGRLLREMSLVPYHPAQSVFGEAMVLPERLHPVLLDLMDSRDPEIASKARGVCIRFRLSVIVPLLHQRLESGGPGPRAGAAGALASIVGEDAIPDIITHVNDPDARVRTAVLNALGQLEVTSAKDEILHRLETDEDSAVREAAIKAYGKVASKAERNVCLRKITETGDSQTIRIAARVLYEGTGPRQRTELEEQRIRRIRGDSQPKKHIDPIGAVRALPEIRQYREEELTKIVASACGDYSTTRRQMVMEGRHALMRRENGIYTFTQIGEAVWRVGQFMEAAKQRLVAYQQN